MAGGGERRGGLFVLCGIDGAGKSTALARVTALRPDWEVGSYDPRDWLPHPELGHLDPLLERHPRDVLGELRPIAGAAFLAQLVLAHGEHWLAPRLAEGKVVVLDSYHYRFQAKLAARGRAPAFLAAALGELSPPDAVLLLEIDPREAARRKGALDEHEFLERATEDDFVRFQTRVWSEVRELCRRDCADVVSLDATAPPEAVAREVVRAVEERLA